MTIRRQKYRKMIWTHSGNIAWKMRHAWSAYLCFQKSANNTAICMNDISLQNKLICFLFHSSDTNFTKLVCELCNSYIKFPRARNAIRFLKIRLRDWRRRRSDILFAKEIGIYRSKNANIRENLMRKRTSTALEHF